MAMGLLQLQLGGWRPLMTRIAPGPASAAARHTPQLPARDEAVRSSKHRGKAGSERRRLAELITNRSQTLRVCTTLRSAGQNTRVWQRAAGISAATAVFAAVLVVRGTAVLGADKLETDITAGMDQALP
jgi:hypothetical protein